MNAGTAIVIGAAAVTGLLWASQSKAKAKTPGCPIDELKLQQWALSRGIGGVYLRERSVPPAWGDVSKVLVDGAPVIRENFVVVTNNGRFWIYDGNFQPVEMPSFQKDYCST